MEQLEMWLIEKKTSILLENKRTEEILIDKIKKINKYSVKIKS